MSWAVITGASSGLGAIFADQLAKRGHSLVLAGRDEARLKAVAHRIDQNVELVVGDLGTTKGVEDLITQLANREIDVLVNNAGFGTYGPFAEIDAEREHELVAVNVDALVRLTHAVLPKMLARGRGGILNVASTIAFQPGPYQATYGASKAFVLSLSQALWAETRGTGVTVTALCPGPTRTGFVDALGSDVSHTAVYRHLAAPEPVVAAGLKALDGGRAVVVPGWRNQMTSAFGHLTPGSLSARVAGRMLRPAQPAQPGQPNIGKRRLAARLSRPFCIRPRTSASTCPASGAAPNSAAMSIGGKTSVTILVGSGMFTGARTLSPNGHPKVIGRMSVRKNLRSNLVSRSRRESHVPRLKYSWPSCPPMDTVGTIGTPASMAVVT